MSKITRGWNAERRAKQAQRMRQNTIWKASTGPKTKRGKAISKMNALTHGGTTQEQKNLRKALSQYRTYLKQTQKMIEKIQRN